MRTAGGGGFSFADARLLMDAIAKTECEEKLSDFIRQAWPVLEPDRQYLHNWHIDAISEYLTACTAGQIRRLVINIPPRYMKSLCVSVLWPTWIWGPRNMPAERFLFASYGSGGGQNPSARDSLRRRMLMASEWYRAFWGDRVAFAKDQNQKTYYQNARGGSMFSTTMGAAGLGFGGNWIIVDDPNKTQGIISRAEREAVIDFYSQTLSRRLDDKKRGVIVLFMQRLAVDDLSGFLLEQKDTRGQRIWAHLRLPAEVKDREIIIFPISQRQHVREPGELLWPEREGPLEIEMAKIELQSRGYAGQYDQEPVPVGGAVFLDSWWHYYRDTPPRFSRTVLSIDCAAKEKDHNDFSVITVWGIDADHGKVYLLHVWRGKPNSQNSSALSLRIFLNFDKGCRPCSSKTARTAHRSSRNSGKKS
jgi:hypothetical protein